MVVVEPDLACVELADAALHGLELGLGLLRAGGGLLDGLRQPRHGLVDGLDAGTHGVDLAGQPGQPLAAVGLGAHGRQVCAFGLGGDALASRSARRAPRQPVAADSRQLGEQLLLMRGDVVGLGVQRLGVGAGGRLRFGVEMLGALAGDADRRADPFGQRRQPKPRLLGRLGAVAESGDRRLSGRRARSVARRPAGRPSRRVRGAASSRRWSVPLNSPAAGNEVVGGQPQPGVAQVGLDGLARGGPSRPAGPAA